MQINNNQLKLYSYIIQCHISTLLFTRTPPHSLVADKCGWHRHMKRHPARLYACPYSKSQTYKSDVIHRNSLRSSIESDGDINDMQN